MPKEGAGPSSAGASPAVCGQGLCSPGHAMATGPVTCQCHWAGWELQGGSCRWELWGRSCGLLQVPSTAHGQPWQGFNLHHLPVPEARREWVCPLTPWSIPAGGVFVVAPTVLWALPARGRVLFPNPIQALLCPARIHTQVLTTAFEQLLWKIKTGERRVGAGDSGSLFVICIVWGALN